MSQLRLVEAYYGDDDGARAVPFCDGFHLVDGSDYAYAAYFRALFALVVVQDRHGKVSVRQMLHKARNYLRARISRPYYYSAFKLGHILLTRFIVKQNGFYQSVPEAPYSAQTQRKQNVHENNGRPVHDQPEFAYEFCRQQYQKGAHVCRDKAQYVVFAGVFPHRAVAAEDEQHENVYAHRQRQEKYPAVVRVSRRRRNTVKHDSVGQPV